MYKPWKIVHLDLSQRLSDLHAGSDIQGLYLVFWWKNIPLGQLEVGEAQLPMPASQLAVRAAREITPAVGDHLLENGFEARLPVKNSPPSRDQPADFETLNSLHRPLKQLHQHLSTPAKEPGESSVSVIVCTRDRPQQLMQCLDALQRLTDPPEEILVIDNAPQTEETRRIVDQKHSIRYVLEPRSGLSIARNTGIRHAKGEIIAFTDDDVVVHPDWTIRLQQALSKPDVFAATGLILPAALQTEAQYLFQQGHGDFGWGYRSLTFGSDFFDQMKYRGVPVWHVGAGANMAFRREAFDKFGLFDERLGAGAAGCSEDSEMWYRILAEGKRCRYEPTAVVHHHHRTNLDELEHQMHHYMRGHITALLVQYERYGHVGNLYRAFGILPAYYARLILRQLRGNRSQAETLSAQISGCAAGIKYYLGNRIVPTLPQVGTE